MAFRDKCVFTFKEAKSIKTNDVYGVTDSSR
jgi:hypothetical protein